MTIVTAHSKNSFPSVHLSTFVCPKRFIKTV